MMVRISISWPCDLPASASQSAGIIGVSHHAWPCFFPFKSQFTLQNKGKANFNQEANIIYLGSPDSTVLEALSSPFIQFLENRDVIRMESWVNFQEIQDMVWDYSTYLN